ncbi:MAG: hypothetical protein NTZ05_00190, partial [Chloroflexi bacterium]|nr:hypothetical protein [Chloroflexota bacterium]
GAVRNGTVSVSGSGFQPGRPVTITWDSPEIAAGAPGGSPAGTLAVVNAGALGGVSTTFAVPGTAPFGNRVITATQGAVTTTAAFSVLQQTVTLTGSVLERGTAAGVTGAQVSVNQPSASGGGKGFQITTVTGVNGLFSFSVPEGSYNVGAVVAGRRVLTQETGVTVSAAGQFPATLVFEVEPPGQTIRGQVQRSGGAGVNDALVTLIETDAAGQAVLGETHARTAAGLNPSSVMQDGLFSFQVQKGKRWRLSAFVPQGGVIGPVTLNGGAVIGATASGTPETFSNDLTLPATQTLVGWVKVGETGLSGVQVTAQATGGAGGTVTGGISAATDAGGNYQLSLLRPDTGSRTYPLQFWAPQLGTLQVAVSVDSVGSITCVAAQALTNCDAANKVITTAGLTVRATVQAITVNLVSQQGGGGLLQPFTAREVSVQALSATLPGNSVTGANVSSLSIPLIQGSYDVTVNVTGFGTFRTLPSARTISGRVTDSTANPAANGLGGAVVNVVGITDAAFGVTTVSCAVVSADCLAVGDYSVTVPAGVAATASYVVTVAKAGFLPGGNTVVAVGTAPVALNPALTPASAGQRVRGSATGTGLPNEADVTVTAVRDGSVDSDNRTVIVNRGVNRTECPVTSATEYCLNLSAGTWSITARSNGFATTAANPVAVVTVDAAIQAGPSLILEPIAGFQSKAPQTQGIDLAAGAQAVDQVNGATVKIPAGAIPGGSGGGAITTRQTTDIATPGGVGIPGGRAVKVDVLDSNGGRIT